MAYSPSTFVSAVQGTDFKDCLMKTAYNRSSSILLSDCVRNAIGRKPFDNIEMEVHR